MNPETNSYPFAAATVIGPDSKIVKLYRENEWKPDQVTEGLRQIVQH